MEASDFDGALLEKPLQDLKLCDVNIFCLRLSNVSKIKQPSYTRAGLYRPGTRLPVTHDHVTTQATSKVNLKFLENTEVTKNQIVVLGVDVKFGDIIKDFMRTQHAGKRSNLKSDR